MFLCHKHSKFVNKVTWTYLSLELWSTNDDTWSPWNILLHTDWVYMVTSSQSYSCNWQGVDQQERRLQYVERGAHLPGLRRFSQQNYHQFIIIPDSKEILITFRTSSTITLKWFYKKGCIHNTVLSSKQLIKDHVSVRNWQEKQIWSYKL